MLDFRGHTSGFRWNDWYIYSKCMFISVYNSAILLVSVQHCLRHSKETAHWAVQCLDTYVAQYFTQLVTISWGGNSTQSRGVSLCRGWYLKKLWNGVCMGLLPMACKAVTCSPCSSMSGRLSEQVGASYQKSYLHVFLSAARGVVIWAFHVTSRLVQT